MLRVYLSIHPAYTVYLSIMLPQHQFLRNKGVEDACQLVGCLLGIQQEFGSLVCSCRATCWEFWVVDLEYRFCAEHLFDQVECLLLFLGPLPGNIFLSEVMKRMCH